MVAVPKRAVAAMEMRYGFASMNKQYHLGKKAAVEKEYEKTVTQNLTNPAKTTKQKGIRNVVDGKLHGGEMQEEENRCCEKIGCDSALSP